MPADRPVSGLVLQELYETADVGWVDRMLSLPQDARPAASVIERWKRDPSAWARKTRIEFVRRCDRKPGGRLPFKRLFKQAWHAQDHELMAAFLVRLDRAIRRGRVRRYERVGRTYEPYLALVTKPRGMTLFFRSPTTHYLRRRAWRYFRRLGFRSPDDYPAAVAIALVDYTDDDIRAPENLLDNWGLVHACFGKSDAVRFGRRHTNVIAESGLGGLKASPMFERLWAAPAASVVLFGLVLEAKSRAVRLWAIELLKRHHAGALSAVDADTLLRLIDHDDEDVAAFAAELLADSKVVGNLPVTTWLRLLTAKSGAVAASVVEAFRRNVAFDRLTIPQAVAVARHSAVPVARLGLDVLQTRAIESDADRDAVTELADARCPALGEPIGRYGVTVLNVPGGYQLARVIRFLDSRMQSMREGAFAAVDDLSPAGVDPAFWSALLESPYDDIRLRLVDRLKQRRSLPGASTDSLRWLWEGVLLNVHRGGRAKLSAVVQVSRRMTDDPASAAALLPVLAVAIRSVRPPEARHGLAAVVTAVERDPSLADQVSRVLPELAFEAVGGGT